MTNKTGATDMADNADKLADEIWLYPEQGDPDAGEWFWTNDLEGHDPDDVRGAVRYTRTPTASEPPADVVRLVSVPREPTEAMLAAGEYDDFSPPGEDGRYITGDMAEECWLRMIDAYLSRNMQGDG